MSGVVCLTIPLGLWEGYFIISKRTQIESPGMLPSDYYRNVQEPGPHGACSDEYGWAGVGFTGQGINPLLRRQYSFDLPTGGQSNEVRITWVALNVELCISGEPPAFGAVSYGSFAGPYEGGSGMVNQPSDGRGLYLGSHHAVWHWMYDTDCDGILEGHRVEFPLWDATGDNLLTFTAPMYYGPNTPVIFTFEGVNYGHDPSVPLDLTQVTYNGQTPVATNNATGEVGYLITVNGGETNTISQSSFSWPNGGTFTVTNNYSCNTVLDQIRTENWLRFTGFHRQGAGRGRPLATYSLHGSCEPSIDTGTSLDRVSGADSGL